MQQFIASVIVLLIFIYFFYSTDSYSLDKIAYKSCFFFSNKIIFLINFMLAIAIKNLIL